MAQEGRHAAGKHRRGRFKIRQENVYRGTVYGKRRPTPSWPAPPAGEDSHAQGNQDPAHR